MEKVIHIVLVGNKVDVESFRQSYISQGGFGYFYNNINTVPHSYFPGKYAICSLDNMCGECPKIYYIQRGANPIKTVEIREVEFIAKRLGAPFGVIQLCNDTLVQNDTIEGVNWFKISEVPKTHADEAFLKILEGDNEHLGLWRLSKHMKKAETNTELAVKLLKEDWKDRVQAHAKTSATSATTSKQNKMTEQIQDLKGTTHPLKHELLDIFCKYNRGSGTKPSLQNAKDLLWYDSYSLEDPRILMAWAIVNEFEPLQLSNKPEFQAVYYIAIRVLANVPCNYKDMMGGDFGFITAEHIKKYYAN